MPTIEYLSALEILDSRGRPTVLAACRLRGGQAVTASVPSGASTGSAEALELRDGDVNRYDGLGCRKAVANVNGPIAAALVGRDFADQGGQGAQGGLDRALIELDGTETKSRLGANAILAVSIVFARAVAIERGVPLYQHFADIIHQPLRTLPRLTVNLFSGGKHAGGQVAIQDCLIVPLSARTIDEGLATVYAVYQAAIKLTLKKYKSRALKADEGGLAPPFASIEQMLDDAVESIRAAGFTPGKDVALAIDVASSHFYEKNVYSLDGEQLDSSGMIQVIQKWTARWPIISVEDGLSENDWDHWPRLNQAIGTGNGEGGAAAPLRAAKHTLVLGDDLLCTNPTRIARAIDTQSANALLLKVNQIGTLSQAAEALKLARSAGWKVTVSARSGETEDHWLADLAVGWGGDQIKVGSINQSERLAKYNRLLQIEAETKLPVSAW